MRVELWERWKRARVRARLAAARAGQDAGNRFAEGYAAQRQAPQLYPVVSTAHAELYEYEEPDDAEPGLRP